MPTPRLLVCLALPALALAQSPPTHISPLGAASGLGGTNNNIPFSWSPTGYQQVHSKQSFSNQTPTPFTRMRMRMASGFVNYAGKTIDVELFHGASPNDAVSASSVFASNIVTGSEVNTLVRKQVNLPTVPNNDWAITFPFDNIYVWTGTHLEWRANVYGNSNGNQIFTYPLDAWSSSGAASNLGTGCIAAGATAAASLTSGTASLGGTMTFTATSGVATVSPLLLTLGDSSTLWGAIPLPFDLTGLNAPGCRIFNNILATIPSATNSSGSASIPLAIPNLPGLGGATFLAQAVIVDGTFNGLGLITSNSRSLKIAGGPDITRIYAIGSPGGGSGTIGVNYGMAVGFN